MRISFPQKLFDSPNKTMVNNGKSITKKSNILFCGIARDVERTLNNNIQRARFIGKYFQNFDIFIYENDSTDSTLDIIKNSNINYLSEKRQDADYKQKIHAGQDNNQYNRCKVLADCRNQYLSYAKNSDKAFDYICVIDWDIYGWSYSGFFDSICRLYNKENLVSVSAYGVLSEYTNTKNLEDCKNNLLMYDSFAFRPLGCYQPIMPGLQASFNQIKITEPILVRSNFGGLCIYKKQILDYTYEVETKSGYVDCDHVTINDKLSRSGYQHMVNNTLIVSYSRHRFTV